MDNLTQNFLLDLATNTPFVAFLIWQYWNMRKDLKDQRDRMDTIRKDSKTEEEALRNRYQVVIETYTKERKELVDSLEKRIVSLEKGIRKIFGMMDEMKQIKDKVDQLLLKEEIRNIKNN